MKNRIILLLVLLVALPAWGQQHDCKLWYKQPAANWNEALPLGNGRLGAMVFGDWRRETIQLNEESLWAGCRQEADANAAAQLPELQQLLVDGKVEEAVALSEKCLRSNPLRIRSYQSFGELYIDLPNSHKPKNYRRELDLETGIATVAYEMGGVVYTREMFVSAKDDVMALRMSADKPGALTFRLQYHREQDATAYPMDNRTLGIQGQVFDLPVKDAGEPGLHMKFAGQLRGECKGGTMEVASNAFYVEKADEVVFYFTAATDYDFARLNFDRNVEPLQVCTGILDKVDGKPYDEVKRVHAEEHGALFNRVSFNMGGKPELPTDERLGLVKKGETDLSLITLYFQYGRYLLMNSSRFPGILPANLQGIWCQDMKAAWNSDFHTNINIQMNYW